MNWGWHLANGGGMWGLLGMLVMVVLIVGLVWLVVLVLRPSRQAPPAIPPWQAPNAQPPYGQPYGPAAQPRPTPYEILRERLARGEITVDEYQRTLAALGPEAGPGPQGPQPPASF